MSVPFITKFYIMTEQQIEKYKYCSEYKNVLIGYKNLKFIPAQRFGCDSRAPKIERELQNIHTEMYRIINGAIDSAIAKVDSIITSI